MRANIHDCLSMQGGLQAAALGDEGSPDWAQNINLAEIAQQGR